MSRCGGGANPRLLTDTRSGPLFAAVIIRATTEIVSTPARRPERSRTRKRRSPESRHDRAAFDDQFEGGTGSARPPEELVGAGWTSCPDSWASTPRTDGRERTVGGRQITSGCSATPARKRLANSRQRDTPAPNVLHGCRTSHRDRPMGSERHGLSRGTLSRRRTLGPVKCCHGRKSSGPRFRQTSLGGTFRHAAPWRLATCRNHVVIWFQLTKIRLTTKLPHLKSYGWQAMRN